MKCEICGRTLTAAQSISMGIGPECAARYQSGAAAAGSSVARLDMLASLGDGDVSRWVRLAKRAIGAGRTRDVCQFIEAAERAALAVEALPLAA